MFREGFGVADAVAAVDGDAAPEANRVFLEEQTLLMVGEGGGRDV